MAGMKEKLKSKFTVEYFKEEILGDYDYKTLCSPQIPFVKRFAKAPRFFPIEARMPFLVTLAMGCQHAFSMSGSLVITPVLYATLATDPEVKPYLISASFFMGGLMTILHCIMFPIPFTKQKWWFGTGIISTIGVTSSFLPIFNSMYTQLKADDPSLDWNDIWGKWLGTVAVAAIFPTLVSFMKPKHINKIFPPYVVGIVIILIGTSLLGGAMKNMGGGGGCYAVAVSGAPPTKIPSCLVQSANGTFVPGVCYNAPVKTPCVIGDLKIQFGDPRILGLSLTVFAFLIVIELFGSPFMRNCEIMLALLLGYMVSALITIDGKKLVTGAQLRTGEVFTLPLFKTFPLGFYSGALIPLLVSQVVGIVECIGDVSATEEGSRVATFGPDHDRRVQGGLLGSGICQILCPLLTAPPAIVYASNSGIVTLSRCASWRAGAAAGAILMAIGIFGRIGSFFAAIPTPILGAVTLFVFGIIFVQGIKICHEARMTRKERFVMALILAIGAGIDIAPNTWQVNFWKMKPGMSGFEKTMRDTVLIIFGSGLTFGSFVTIFVNLLIPEDNLVYDVLPDAFASSTHGHDGQKGVKVVDEAAFKVESADPIDKFKTQNELSSDDGSVSSGSKMPPV